MIHPTREQKFAEYQKSYHAYYNAFPNRDAAGHEKSNRLLNEYHAKKDAFFNDIKEQSVKETLILIIDRYVKRPICEKYTLEELVSHIKSKPKRAKYSKLSVVIPVITTEVMLMSPPIILPILVVIGVLISPAVMVLSIAIFIVGILALGGVIHFISAVSDSRLEYTADVESQPIIMTFWNKHNIDAELSKDPNADPIDKPVLADQAVHGNPLTAQRKSVTVETQTDPCVQQNP